MALAKERSERTASRSLARRASVSSWPSWPTHWNGVWGLGPNPADRDGAADVARPGHLAAGGDDLLRQVGDLQDVVVGLGRQAAHEVELDLAPARGVRGGHRVDQVLLGDHLVDDLADALAAALRR